MKTLGIDLASQPARTAACMITWEGSEAVVADPTLDLDDDVLLAMIATADKVGIDAPFGWPEKFIETVVAHRQQEEWPSVDLSELRYRLTDRIVIESTRHRPLSVSSDLIGVTAMRCGRLLSALGATGERVDRSGGGKVVEVYPAAALVVWGFNPRGYKRVTGQEKRKQLLEEMQASTQEWLRLNPSVIQKCSLSDDCLDALIAALIARAAAVGATLRPTREQAAITDREGWIHLPLSQSLDLLARK